MPWWSAFFRSAEEKKKKKSTDSLVVCLQSRPSVVPFTPPVLPGPRSSSNHAPAEETIRGQRDSANSLSTTSSATGLQRKVTEIGSKGRRPEPQPGNDTQRG